MLVYRKKIIMLLLVSLLFLSLIGCESNTSFKDDLDDSQTTNDSKDDEKTTNNTENDSTNDDTSTTVVDYDAYYDSAEGLTGEQLKQALHDIIDDHTMLSYDEVKYAIKDTDEDPENSNNVILLYTNRSQAKSTFGGGKDDFNREHVWAKSHGDFGNATGPGTDLHHIRPTDASVNSSRQNLDFDNGGTVVEDGSKNTLCLSDNDSFEVPDNVKGDVARMIFYMAVRYEGDDGFVDLEINEYTNNGSDKSPYMGKLSTLIEWHLNDLPDEFELHRNDVIETYQGNRNPFIDYPEFVEMIFG